MNHLSSVVIAVDGLAATGKGTLARRLAKALDFAYLDTGLLYRAVGLSVLRSGGDPSNPKDALKAAQALASSNFMEINEDLELRTDKAGGAASKVAVMPEVREALLAFQKEFASHPPEGKPGAVLDGRDIGTVVAPDALVKIYVEASPEIRAHRRFLELQARGENATEAAVLEEMKVRDARDASRDAAPTRAAEDAVQLNTSELDADETFREALLVVKTKLESALLSS